MVKTYEVVGYGINSNLGREQIKFQLKSNYDYTKDEYSENAVRRMARAELIRRWGTDAVEVISIR